MASTEAGKIAVGSRVRVIGPPNYYRGAEGVVMHIAPATLLCLVKISGRPEEIPFLAEELQVLEPSLDRPEPLTQGCPEFPIGSHVRVTSGMTRGEEGVVVRQDPSGVYNIIVKLFSRGWETNFNEEELELLSNHPPVPGSKPAPPDMIVRPHHYARHQIEPITFINANGLPYNIGNAIKYLCRYDAKNGVEDLKKARRYIDIQLECMARQDRVSAGEAASDVWKEAL